MSICLEHLHEYELTCCPSNHNIPVEMRAASSLALSDASLLLINSGTDRLLLYDLSVSTCKLHDINWPSDTYGVIRDICWSKYINLFLILGDDVVCSYSPISNQLIIVLKSSSLNGRFWSLTVLGCDAYILCRHDTLYRYCLPSWTLCHTWSRTDLIDIYTTDKFIQMIRAHPSMGSIALLIRLKRHRQWRIDLFDRRMKKLHSGEPIRMASAYPNVNIRPYAHHGQWILMNEDFIWRIDFNGQLIEHQSRQQKKETD